MAAPAASMASAIIIESFNRYIVTPFKKWIKKKPSVFYSGRLSIILNFNYSFYSGYNIPVAAAAMAAAAKQIVTTQIWQLFIRF